MEASIPQKTVLVIEDELNTRIFLSNLLSSNGFSPINAATQGEGLLKAEKEKPDAIILDMMLPGEGGIQLYRRFKRDDGLKDIPVIMISTLERKAYFQYREVRDHTAREALPEPDAFLQKPPEADEFIATLSRITGATDFAVPPRPTGGTSPLSKP